MIKTVSQLLQRFSEMENEMLKQQNIDHRPTIGDMYEELTHDLLDKALPCSSELNVSSGFITDDNGNLSAELDCLLVCGEGESIPYIKKRKYQIDDVVAVIQVKKNLYSADIEDGYNNLLSVMNFSPTLSKRTVLLRDAFQSITRRPLPEPEDVDKLPIEIGMIYRSLVTELYAPLRIILGYNGFKSHSNFRQSVADYLFKQCDGTPRKGFGPTSFPSLIICGKYSLVKCNGMPFSIPLEDDYVWPFYWSKESRPIELLLELIWTRLVYQQKMSPSVFDDDLWLGSFARFISVKLVTKEEKQGWEYLVTPASDDELQQPIEERMWEPVFIDQTQFVIMNLLCSDGEVDLAEADCETFIRSNGWTLNAFVESLNSSGLAARNGNKLVLLTRGCSCVILPDGRYVAGENIANQLTKWLDMYIFERKNSEAVDSLKLEVDSLTIPLNEPLFIKDDDKALKVISILGLSESLEKAKQIQKDKNCIILVSEHHSTHWIAACHAHGFPQAKDNGYFVVCYPKGSMSFKDFKLLVQSPSIFSD